MAAGVLAGGGVYVGCCADTGAGAGVVVDVLEPLNIWNISISITIISVGEAVLAILPKPNMLSKLVNKSLLAGVGLAVGVAVGLAVGLVVGLVDVGDGVGVTDVGLDAVGLTVGLVVGLVVGLGVGVVDVGLVAVGAGVGDVDAETAVHRPVEGFCDQTGVPFTLISLA